jgi:hypothetical protein
MRQNVIYNGVAEVPKPSRHQEGSGADDAVLTGSKPAEVDTTVESSTNEEVAETEEERIANGAASEEAGEAPWDARGRRPGCKGTVRVNEGDAW